MRGEPIQVAIVSRTVFYVPLWIAVERGYFHEECLSIAVKVYDDAQKITADLRSGATRIAISTPESIIADAYHGGTLRVVAGNAERLPHYIITQPTIHSIAELRGASIGVLSLREGTTYFVRRIAAAAGLAPDEYRLCAVGGAPTRWLLLQQAQIDAGLQPFPLSYEAEAAGFNNLGPVSDYVPAYQFTSINVESGWAARNRDVIERVLRALARGQRYMFESEHDAAMIAARELRATIPLALRALRDLKRLQILSADLSISHEGLATTFEAVRSAGLVEPSARFDLQRIADEHLWREPRM